MKKFLIASLFAGCLLLGVGTAKAEIATSTPTLASLPMHAAVSTGLTVKACVFNAGAANQTITVYDGSTVRFAISIPTSTTVTVDFAKLLGEEWTITGALNFKANVEDALGRISCTFVHKRIN